MQWTLYTQEDFVTTHWSGGTTTQLAIAPEGAQYAGRDFLWRLSSARVEADHSTFTHLPDYDRFLAVLEGNLELKVGEEVRTPLPRGQVRTFDGGTPVESWGWCTDFNLMLRKGKCRGTVQTLTLLSGQPFTWTIPVDDCSARTLVLYVVSGTLSMPEEARTGELLLCRGADGHTVRLESKTGGVVMAAVISSSL